MQLPSFKTSVIGILILMFGSVVGRLEGIRSDIVKPAVIIDNLFENDGVAVRGGDLVLTATVDKKKDCRTEVDRWLYQSYRSTRGDVAGFRVFPLGNYASFPVPVGDRSEVEIHIPIPSYVPRGKYMYMSRAKDECTILPGWISPTDRTIRPIPVEIGDPKIADKAQVLVPPGVEVVPTK